MKRTTLKMMIMMMIMMIEKLRAPASITSNHLPNPADSTDSSITSRRHRQRTVLNPQLFHLSTPTSFVHNSEVTLITTPQELVVPLNSRVSLECEFIMESFRVFDNPMVWEKQQNNQERDPINLMGVIMDPFASTRRYEVVLDENAPLYGVKLKIRDLSPEDSGNYTCELRGKKSKVLGRVTHTLSVISPIRQLQLIPDTGLHVSDSQMSLKSMTFNESQPTSVICNTRGGYPSPTITILLNEKNITDRFHNKRILEISGNRSMRSLAYRTSSWSDDFHVTSTEDGSILTCSAYVIEPNDVIIASVTVVVNYKPDILCESPVEASPGDRNLKLVCYVRARPEPYSLRWSIHSNATKDKYVDVGGVSDGIGDTNGNQGLVAKGGGMMIDGSDGLYPLVRNLDNNKWETNLFVKKVAHENFRYYRLVCENSIGASEAVVELRPRSKIKNKFGSLSSSSLSSSSSSSSLKGSPSGKSPNDLDLNMRPWYHFYLSSSSSSNHHHHHHHPCYRDINDHVFRIPSTLLITMSPLFYSASSVTSCLLWYFRLNG